MEFSRKKARTFPGGVGTLPFGLIVHYTKMSIVIAQFSTEHSSSSISLGQARLYMCTTGLSAGHLSNNAISVVLLQLTT